MNFFFHNGLSITIGYDPNFANFLMKYEKGEFKNLSEKELRAKFQGFESNLLKKMKTVDLVEYFSANISSVIRSCKYRPMNYRIMDDESKHHFRAIDCSSIKTVVNSIFFGRKCFTFFSNLVDMSDDWRHNIPNVSCSSFKCSHTGLDKDIVYFSDWENLYRMYKRIYSRMIAELNPEINIEIEATDDDWKFMNVDGLFTVASMYFFQVIFDTIFLIIFIDINIFEL